MQILIFIKASVKYNQSTLDCNTIGPLDDLYLYVKVIIKSRREKGKHLDKESPK